VAFDDHGHSLSWIRPVSDRHTDGRTIRQVSQSGIIPDPDYKNWLSLIEGRSLKSLRSPPHRELLRLLIAARNESNLSQQELARRLRRHQSFVSKYEGGERRIEVIEFVQICRAIGVAPDALLRKLP
jgi:predicted transcriptional regulator